jgi:hypothetical protein
MESVACAAAFQACDTAELASNGCGAFVWLTAFQTCDTAELGSNGFAWAAAFHTCDTALLGSVDAKLVERCIVYGSMPS